jgi:hypothetical protein
MRPRRGFAMIFAILSIGLVTTTLATLSILFAGERQLTMSNSADAQLRQLLLAGAADVNEQVKQWGDSAPKEKWLVRLPDELKLGGAELTAAVASASGTYTTVEVIAKIANHQGHQRLEYHRATDHWEFVGAKLGE